ncbi:MAG TPA: hypothetical protein VG870_03375 [Chitinophagaceae bacterium]|nr:hypothetical protein [Chitinophagaceae bacterium]
MMKKWMTLGIFLVCLATLHAQHHVRFIVKEKGFIHRDDIHITGTLCNWDATFLNRLKK